MSTDTPAPAATENDDAAEVTYEQQRAETMRERFGEQPAPRQTETEERSEGEQQEQKPTQQQQQQQPSRKPYQHAVPPNRVEAMLRQRDQRIAELETETRLAREGRLAPVQPNQPAEPPKNARPNPADFKNPDGSFNEDAYIDALTDHATNKALTKLNETLAEREARQQQEAQAADIQRVSAELADDFHSQADEIFASPDLDESVRSDMRAAIEHLTSDAVATHIPLQIQHEIMRAGPGVAYLLAQDKRLISVLQSGDIITATRLVDTATNYLAGRTKGGEQQQQQPPVEREAAPRQPNGQYAPRQQPAGPVEVEGMTTAGTNDYDTHRARRMRENGWA